MSTPNISISDYLDNSSANNAKMICIDDLRIYFSYKTIIVFYTPKSGLVVMQNYWSTTTGKHLNAIDGGNKKNRVDQETFKKLYAETLSEYFFYESFEWNK